MDIKTIKSMTIKELDLSIRATNCLARAEIFTVQDLLDKIKTPDDMIRIRNMGKKSADEIYAKMESLGITMFMGNCISEDQFEININLSVENIGLSDSTLGILRESGIKTVSELMYEIDSVNGPSRIKLDVDDYKEICRAIQALDLRLGVFNEPISALGIFDGLKTKLETLYDEIHDILKVGFSGLLDDLDLPSDAVRTAKQLKKAGYLLVGYPGLDDPEICKKLKIYFLSQPLSFIGVSENVEKRMNLARGNRIRLDYFARRSVRTWYSIIQDYEDCAEIAEKLKKLQFTFRVGQGIDDYLLGKEAFLEKNTLLYSPFEDLGISKQLYHTLIKKGITSVEQLVSFSATELNEQKIAGDAALASIRKALHSGRLLLKDDYLIKCQHCGGYIISNDTSRTICDECIAKQKRIKKISKLDITISGPDYGSYSNLSSGFTLYANIKNTTSDLLKVRLHDFYVVEENKQISFRYFLNGYSFDEETIMPGTVKSAGKIWDTSRFQYSTFLASDAYIIVTVKIATEDHKRMYKFIEKDGKWVIDDFFTA